jgi:hypothetical protein
MSATGQTFGLKPKPMNVRFYILAAQSCPTASVKSFGRREAYESLRGTNPRAADNGLWVFLFSAERGEVTTGSDLRWT